jgi:Ran GTPase-activating protein (RanGAP) involved in mRNA processing and transport
MDSLLEEQILLNQLYRLAIVEYDDLIGLGGIEQLMNLLVHNSAVTELDLSGLYIGPEGTELFIAQLNNTRILRLFLWSNNIGDEGAKYLAEAIKLNSTLQEIYLDLNNIEAQGAEYLAEAIKVNSTLRVIQLNSNNIGDEGTRYFAEAIKVNSALQQINLDYTNIEAEGAKHLAEAIMVNTTLQQINLACNNIGAERAKYFAEAIKVNSALEVINLGYNNIGYEGGQYFAEAIKVNSVLQEIHLEDNNIEMMEFQIDIKLEENNLRKRANYRKFICAFTQGAADSFPLRFDKMILRFVYYPIIMGILPDEYEGMIYCLRGAMNNYFKSCSFSFKPHHNCQDFNLFAFKA